MAQSEDHVTLDLGVWSLSPCWAETLFSQTSKYLTLTSKEENDVFLCILKFIFLDSRVLLAIPNYIGFSNVC